MRFFGVCLLLAFAATPVFALQACGNGANDVDGCRQLEFARCQRAAVCGIDIAYPLSAGSTMQDQVTSCQDFYFDACLHGLATTITVSSGDISGCAAAIMATDAGCNAVLEPQSVTACKWLIPPDAGVDSGTDAAVVDAAVDVETVVVTDATSGPDALQECNDNCDSQCEGDSTCISVCEEDCIEGS